MLIFLLTGSLLKVLNVKVDARDMFTTNIYIYITDDLTNGAMGIVTNVVTIPKNGLNSVYDAILFQFDNCKIGCDAIGNSKYKHINAFSVPIK